MAHYCTFFWCCNCKVWAQSLPPICQNYQTIIIWRLQSGNYDLLLRQLFLKVSCNWVSCLCVFSSLFSSKGLNILSLKHKDYRPRKWHFPCLSTTKIQRRFLLMKRFDWEIVLLCIRYNSVLGRRGWRHVCQRIGRSKKSREGAASQKCELEARILILYFLLCFKDDIALLVCMIVIIITTVTVVFVKVFMCMIIINTLHPVLYKAYKMGQPL